MFTPSTSTARLVRLKKLQTAQCWKLKSYDTFTREFYALEAEYHSEAEALAAAQERLRAQLRTSPSDESREQDEDCILVMGPDGSGYRVVLDGQE